MCLILTVVQVVSPKGLVIYEGLPPNATTASEAIDWAILGNARLVIDRLEV